jgi:uncharacterized coiled-coil DUF342 family protein
MKPFRTGDLTPINPDAAELIDSAQDCAKKLAQCCAEKNELIADRDRQIAQLVSQRSYWASEASRMKEAICEFVSAHAALRKKKRVYGETSREELRNTDALEKLKQIASEEVESLRIDPWFKKREGR